MATWQKIEMNSNSVNASTEKAYLIKVPKEDLYFWHPAKCVRFSGKNNYLMTISFTDEFVFKLFRNGKGKTNSHERIFEIELTADEFIKEYFPHLISKNENDEIEVDE